MSGVVKFTDADLDRIADAACPPARWPTDYQRAVRRKLVRAGALAATVAGEGVWFGDAPLGPFPPAGACLCLRCSSDRERESGIVEAPRINVCWKCGCTMPARERPSA